MWELDHKEGWALKNWCFWTMVLEKTLESPLDWKDIQAVHPKGISPEYSLEGSTPKLKLQYFGHQMWRTDSLEKTLMLEGIRGRRRRGRQMMMASLTRWTCVWVNSGSCWWTGRPGVLWFMGSRRVGHDWVTELIWSDILFYVCMACPGQLPYYSTCNHLWGVEYSWWFLPCAFQDFSN